MLDAKARMLLQKLAQRLTAMGCGIVQQGDHWPPQMAQQLAEKYAYLLLPNVVVVQLIVETQSLLFRTD